jgi:NTE family protein
MRPVTRRLALQLLAGSLPLAGCAAGRRELPVTREPRPVDREHASRPYKVALVLSSGGLRGLAHVGVLRVLLAYGWTPDLLVGSSIGAIVGAAFAAGADGEMLDNLAVPSMLDPWGSWFVRPSARSEALEAFVAELVGQRSIEELPRRLVTVATERNTGCLALFGQGDAARAVVASSALPGALAPVRIADRAFVDGGLAAPLPVRVARALGAQRVVAVDTTFHAEPEVPGGMVDSVLHAGMVMSRHLAQPDRAAADVLIEPRLPPVDEVTLANRSAIVQAGEAAALAQLERLRQVFAGTHTAAHSGGSFEGLPLCDSRSVRWAGPS